MSTMSNFHSCDTWFIRSIRKVMALPDDKNYINYSFITMLNDSMVITSKVVGIKGCAMHNVHGGMVEWCTLRMRCLVTDVWCKGKLKNVARTANAVQCHN